MAVDVSVVIRTHNPRKDYLNDVLGALEGQTLPRDRWELLLIDNASTVPLAPHWDLRWHPHARQIREDELGATAALLRGIHEAQADLIVFVDDDNVLDRDYLEQGMRIANQWPILGAWGGQLRPRFEAAPPEWTRQYWGNLALGELDRDKWSNLTNQWESVPPGAGMFVRKTVARAYELAVSVDPLRKRLGRRGAAIISGEDSGLAFTACDMGLGTGRFRCLRLTHLMPAARLQEAYLLRLIEGMAHAGAILAILRGSLPEEPPLRRRLYLMLLYSVRCLPLSRRGRRFMSAARRGSAAGVSDVLQYMKAGAIGGGKGMVAGKPLREKK